jgi:hypothetical protein
MLTTATQILSTGAFTGLVDTALIGRVKRLGAGVMGAFAIVIEALAHGGLPPEKLNRELVSTMREAIADLEVETDDCLDCDGSGWLASADLDRCHRCEGSGRVCPA